MCSKCGLPTSEDGIIELAEIQQRNESALSDANSLLVASVVPFPFLLLALLAGAGIPIATFSIGFITFVSLGVFWYKYFRWWLDYASNPYPDDSFKDAIFVRRRSALVASFAVVLLAALLYMRT